MPTKRRRIMVNVPKHLEKVMEERAAHLNRSLANYIEWLIAQDVKQASVEEVQDPYSAGAKAPPHLSGEKPPQEKRKHG